jgi:hypothetical protein
VGFLENLLAFGRVETRFVEFALDLELEVTQSLCERSADKLNMIDVLMVKEISNILCRGFEFNFLRFGGIGVMVGVVEERRGLHVKVAFYSWRENSN